MLDRVWRFHRCIRHVPLKQLARRSWLNVKRLMTPHLPFAAPSLRLFATRNNPPLRIMPSRRHRIGSLNGAYQLVQLGKSHDLKVPIDWNLRQFPAANHLDRLAIHYHEFLESVPFEIGLDAILDWIEMNSWRSKDAWKLGWNCYAISIRATCWMQWLAEFGDRLDASTRNAIIASLSSQIRYLADNLETDIGGNHLLKNLTCLLWAGAFFDDPETDILARNASILLAQQLKVQFLRDGMHFELSPAYHCQVFVDLLHCHAALHAAGKDTAKVEAVLGVAAQVVADLAHPDGQISLFSDSALDMGYRPEVCLKAYRELTETSVQARKCFAMKESGYFGLRCDKTFLLIDCGPSCADSLPAHGHADMLSFEWDVLERRIIVDAGVYEYECGKLRTFSRTAKSHNTVTVGDRDQCEFVGSFRVGRRAHAKCDEANIQDGLLILEGHHWGYSDGSDKVRHRRRFEARDGYLQIQDAIEGGQGQETVSRLLLHHECTVRQTDNQHLEIERSGVTVHLSTSTGSIHVIHTHWFPNFGESRETHQIELHYGPAPCEGAFELLFASTGRS